MCSPQYVDLFINQLNLLKLSTLKLHLQKCCVIVEIEHFSGEIIKLYPYELQYVNL